MKYLLIATIATTLIYFSGALQKADTLWKAWNGAKVESLLEHKADNKMAVKPAAKSGADDLARARDDMFAMSYTPSAPCMKLSKSSLEELQCKNEKAQAYASFKASFEAKLATGWRPN